MIKIIAAVSSNGVMGFDNKLPFDYKSDLQHFKKMTLNSRIIMGRKTFESIGRPLPKRENVVISSKSIDGITTFNNLKDSLIEDCWLIGGRSIYEEGMNYAQEIYLTITSDYIKDNNSIYFPFINPLKFKIDNIDSDTLKEDNLKIVKYCTF